MILPGLMQQRSLMISDILEYAARAHPEREIVSVLVDELRWRYDYRGLVDRAKQCARMLGRLGVGPGDRVTSLAWNTHRHLELFFAVPGMGAVLNTANPRFSEDQLVYTINHAESRVLLYDRSAIEVVERLRPRLPLVSEFVVLAGSVGMACREAGVRGYEDLLASASADYQWPRFDENAAAFLCYTSGTTGHPKGALYSHRSVVLHAMAAGLNAALGFDAFDCIMPCQSLYHATGWGLPFVAAINGCKLVLPCNQFDGASLHQLITSEGVTFSGGVPTIWTMYLDHLARNGETPGTLQRLVIGGSAVPRAMAEAFQKHGVLVRQLWGMTETSPMGVVATPTPRLAELGDAEMNDVIWTRQGRLQFGLEMKIVDDEGSELPCDGESAGAIMVRGPWVIERYYRAEATALDADGWFDTGDIGTIDANGFMRITDREKDVIKSGGEWISSIDLENAAAALGGVKVAAVVGVFHPKWEERPILVLELHDAASIGKDDIVERLSQHVPKWWLPDAVFFAAVPLTATGKIDKKQIRETYKDALVAG